MLLPDTQVLLFFDCAIELACLCYRADVLFIGTSTLAWLRNPAGIPQHIIAQRLVHRGLVFHFLYAWLLGFPQGSPVVIL